MLTQNDIKFIKSSQNKYFPLVKYLFIFAIAFSIVGLGYNAYLAINYAGLGGMDLSATASFWNQEIKLEKNYTGYELESLHRLNMAILNLGLVVLFSIHLRSITTERKRNKRIYSELIKCGSVENEIA